MKRNGSGVYDGTAYKAMMGAPKPGEIWTYNDGEKEVLVIKNHGTHSTVLSLLNECRNKNCIEITSKALKFTDPRMVQYAFNANMGQFVKALSDEDFDKVLDEIEDALEINIYQAEESEEIKKLKAEVDSERKLVKELETQLAEAKCAPASPAESIYKRLYDDLIDKLIDKKVM